VAWHGLTAREAATVLGCSRPAFFVRLHRARRRLETAYEGRRRKAATQPEAVSRPARTVPVFGPTRER
jgi:RNA polymerase sigma-70 factor, ECF subfamily